MVKLLGKTLHVIIGVLWIVHTVNCSHATVNISTLDSIGELSNLGFSLILCPNLSVYTYIYCLAFTVQKTISKHIPYCHQPVNAIIKVPIIGTADSIIVLVYI